MSGNWLSDVGCVVCADADAAADADVLRTARWRVFVPWWTRTRGSLAVAPRQCVPAFGDVSPDDAVELFQLVHRVLGAVERSLDPDGLHVWWDSGALAGQVLDHMVVEIVPRYPDAEYRYRPLNEIPVVDLATRASQAARSAAALSRQPA